MGVEWGITVFEEKKNLNATTEIHRSICTVIIILSALGTWPQILGNELVNYIDLLKLILNWYLFIKPERTRGKVDLSGV